MSEKEKETKHEKHLVDFVYMQAPGSAPGVDDGEVIKVSTSGQSISRKMFEGYRQVDSAKGNKE